MDYFHDFAVDFQQAFDQCKARINSYPEDFQKSAFGYLDGLNICAADYQGSCLSQLLPFWLRPVFRTPPEVYRAISVANTFGFLYFLIQDTVMDTSPGEYQADLLPLANLFLLDFLEDYRSLFPHHPLFWEHFKNYFTEWAESVIRERNGFWSSPQSRNETGLLELARKSAPLKISCVAACLLSGRESAIKSLTRIIDATIITFQLLDDWNDWREDQATGNCSFFLAQVIQCCGIENLSHLQEDHVRTAVYGYDIFERMLEIAFQNHSLLKSGQVPHVPYLIAYHQDLVETFRKMSSQIQTEKKAMLQGGFFYLLHCQKSDNF